MQIPHGPSDKNCHRCLPKAVPCSKVCHKCNLWMSVRGKDKNTGKDIDEWLCSDRANILWLAEIAKNTFSGVVATEHLRNETNIMHVVTANAIKENQSQPSRHPYWDGFTENEIKISNERQKVLQITTVECDQC